MDQETRDLVIWMIQVIETSYTEVFAYTEVLCAKMPQALTDVVALARDPQHQANVHQRFALALDPRLRPEAIKQALLLALGAPPEPKRPN